MKIILAALLLTASASALVLTSSPDPQRVPPPQQNTLTLQAKGKVKLDNSKNGQAILSASNMVPGQVVSGSVTLRNRSVKARRLRLVATSQGELVSALNITVSQQIKKRVKKRRRVSTDVVYQGPLASLTNLKFKKMKPREKRVYLFSTQLLPDVTNQLMGKEASVTFTWKGR